jgi:ABC-2 type transport system ATP-binding protein
MELTQWKNNKVDELSKGMQQKVQFIATVAHQPPLLILDEPFSGLDPVNALLLQDIIVELKQKGTTIIFSTHRMEQVEEFCDWIALINQGRIVLNDSVARIRKEFRQDRYTFEVDDDLTGVDFPPEYAVLSRHRHTADLELTANGGSARELLGWMNDRFTVLGFRQYVPPMRDIFIQTVRETSGTPAPVAG